MNKGKLSNKTKSNLMKQKYRKWKMESLDEAGYFVIFQGFLESGKLSQISGNALKLYVYLGINSSNLEGVVWHSNSTIGRYFNKSERTIRTWMKELEDLGLIKRMRLKYDGMPYTYLKTYDAKIKTENVKLVEGILYINKQNQIGINDGKVNVPIPISSFVRVYDNYKGEWLDGQIQIRRNFEFEIVDYVFKSWEDGRIIEITNEKELKAMVLI